jgi:hypothetical protein
LFTSIKSINDAIIETPINNEATMPVKSILGRAAKRATNNELARGANKAI